MFSSTKRHGLLRVAAVLTALVMMFAASAYTAVPQQVSAKSEEQQLKDELADLKDKQKKLQKEQQQLKDDLADEKDKQASYEKQIDNVKEQIEIYQDQIDTVNQAIKETDQKISDKEDEIDQTNKDIKEKEAEIEENDELFKDRLDTMYIANSSNSVLAMLLGAESFSDFLSATETVKTISESDQQLLAELDQQHKDLEQLKKKLEDDKQDLEEAKQEKEDQKAELVDVKAGYEDKQDELADLYEKSGIKIDEITDRQSEVSEEMRENDALIEETQADIKKLQDAAAEAEKEWEESHGGGGSNSGGGNSDSGGASDVKPSASGYLWPLNGGHVTCAYGGYVGHRGVDLSTGVVGTSIFASRTGKVVDVQYWDGHTKTGMQSYGNMVRIYHPETGTYTRYAHCNSIAVREGQWVNQGQVIAYMGNTGNSFGAHLHFELSTGASNSTRINPLPYIT